MQPVIECTGLTKNYGKAEAVRNVDLKLEEGVIYGLLGRNGAGKTTLLNMLSGGTFASYGSIEIAGKKLKPGETPEGLCYVREKNFFLGGARVIEMLEIASAFHPNWDWDYAKDLLKTFNLNASKKIRQLSRGMESLVGNIIGMASRAPLTLYDEPVLGLDVLMRERFYRMLMEDYAECPRTILLSTHLIDEIAPVVEKVYIMDSGSILMLEEVDSLRTRSFLLRGAASNLDSFTREKRVLYRESYGSSGALAAVFDTIDDKEKQEAGRLGITIDELPLQKFFAYLVEGGERNG